jgi:DNA primase
VTASNSDAKSLVLDAVNIVELIGQTVKLKRLGTKYVGLCPFHSEKTPSFNVNPAKRFFYCFGCKASGNAIDFVMKRDRLAFVEAMQLLARQANIELPKFGAGKQNSSERQVMLDAHSAACGLFEKFFAHPQIGAAARDYLAGRGFHAETLKKFQVGFVPEGWDNLLKSQAMKRFNPELLHHCGLLKQRENGGGFYDTFRNRIMFPIRDEQGRIIAFGGRRMVETDNPKYLNSPETPLFSKSRTAYGLDLGRQKIIDSKTVAVVEGYTDVVMAHQYGAANVVSVLGTALTDQHVNLLRRFADRIVLLFDADTAGDLAVDRAVQLLLSQEVEIAIAQMPEGIDPDEFIIAHGADGFEKLLADAQDVLSYKWRQLNREFGSKDDLTSQQKAIEQYLDMLGSARGGSTIDPLRWGAILTRVSRLTEIPAAELTRRFRVPKKQGRSAPAAAAAAPAAPVVRRPPTAQDRTERWIIGSLLAQPGLWMRIQKDAQPQDFVDPQRKALAETLWSHHRNEGEPSFSDVLGMLNDDSLKELAVALLEEVEAMHDIDQTLGDALAHLQQARRRQDDRKLMASLKSTDGADEIEVLRKLQERAREPDIRRAAP